MSKHCIEDADFEKTGYSYTLSLMQRYLKKITDKTLSQHLKELEADGLIVRKVYPQIPPKVEYSLTDRGHSLMEVLDKLCDWGNENRLP